jgi:galactose mutarotase-like enzyme
MSGKARSYETTWLNQPALVLETPSLRFITVPGMGAKIVSLFDKRAEREWLLPPTNREFKPVAYGVPFVDQDMSGWDEVFPTTDACNYPVDGPYRDNALPDHGEVWALPWQVINVTEDSISLSTVGRALPYRLSRTVRVTDVRRITVEFEVVNTGSESFVALWSAHPQFAVDAETRIVLPERADRVVNVHPVDDWPESGRLYPWPEAITHRGIKFRLDRIRSAELRRCRKFYVLPSEPVNWAALQQNGAGDWIRLSWDTSQIPYLGIWVDEGTYNPRSAAALEPTTGFYDRLDLAWRNNAVMRLQPNESYCWQFDIELGTGDLSDSSEA